MTREQYDLSIKTGKLQLSVWGKIQYYFLVVFLFFISVLCVCGLLFDKSKNFIKPPISFVIIPAILGILVYLIQKPGLKFQVIETNLSKKDILLLIKKLCDEQKWSIVSQEDDVLVANSDFVAGAGDKIKKITFLLDRNKVFVNSIADPDLNKSGIDLLGNNREIIKTVIDRLQLAQKAPE